MVWVAWPHALIQNITVVGAWDREPSLLHMDGRQRKKQKGAHSKTSSPSILLPLVKSYFPKFPESLRIALSAETKAPLQQRWRRRAGDSSYPNLSTHIVSTCSIGKKLVT